MRFQKVIIELEEIEGNYHICIITEKEAVKGESAG